MIGPARRRGIDVDGWPAPHLIDRRHDRLPRAVFKEPVDLAGQTLERRPLFGFGGFFDGKVAGGLVDDGG